MKATGLVIMIATMAVAGKGGGACFEGHGFSN